MDVNTQAAILAVGVVVSLISVLLLAGCLFGMVPTCACTCCGCCRCCCCCCRDCDPDDWCCCLTLKWLYYKTCSRCCCCCGCCEGDCKRSMQQQVHDMSVGLRATAPLAPMTMTDDAVSSLKSK